MLSDWLVVRITINPGETFLDRMTALVEDAKRQKTPNEIALTILLVADPGVPAGHRQPFTDPKYFWSRPSATGPLPNNADASSGSNLGPLNPALADALKARV